MLPDNRIDWLIACLLFVTMAVLLSIANVLEKLTW